VDNSYTDFPLGVIRLETPAAFNVNLAGGMIYWLPKAAIKDADRYHRGQRGGTIEIANWFIEEQEGGISNTPGYLP
jgi:hypothetical protein